MSKMLTVDSYKNLIDRIKCSRAIVLWAIPSDEFLHPCLTDVSAVFIKELVNGDT